MQRALLCAISVWVGTVYAAGEKVVTVQRIDAQGVGEPIGRIVLAEEAAGLRLTPDLKGLPPGLHGFHLHENPDCGPGEKDGTTQAGVAAGGHYDPAGTGRHEGPAGQGHLGDLPALSVDAQGVAATPVTAPRVTLADAGGRALVIHAGGDNYSDQPEKGGGGGARIACGIP